MASISVGLGTSPTVHVQLLDGNGDPVNLTGNSLLEVLIEQVFDNVDSGIFDGSSSGITVTDAVNGKLSWDINPAILQGIGEYNFYWHVVFGSRDIIIPSRQYDVIRVQRTAP